MDIYEFLPEYDKSNEGFVAILMFRRKWAIKYYPFVEQYFKENFKSNECIIDKCVLSGKSDFNQKVNVMIESLKNHNISKDKKLRNGENIKWSKLYEKFPKAFSLMITYAPRDLKQAAKKLTLSMVNILMNDNVDDNWKFLHLDKEWCKFVQMNNSRKNSYLLLDFDWKFSNGNSERYNKILNYLKENNLNNNIEKVIITPSGGLHVILKIDKNVQKGFFKRIGQFKEDIAKLVGIFPEHVVNKFLTHVPCELGNFVRIYDF